MTRAGNRPHKQKRAIRPAVARARLSTVRYVPIVPDDKNWTWVLERPCPECGFDAADVDIGAMGDFIRDNVARWPALLEHERVAVRPASDRWSALEYACHVRDVFRLYDKRLRLMLDLDDPRFENWDQDATAIEDRYDIQDPASVSRELVEAGNAFAALWDTVQPEQLGRRGMRSDGAEFTVASFGVYFLHDPIHHLDDIARGNALLAG